MISFISGSRRTAVDIRKAILKKGIFTHHSGFPSLENAHGIRDYVRALRPFPEIAVIDASEGLDFAEKACLEYKRLSPDVKCIVLIDKSKCTESRFKYVSLSDREIVYISLEHLSEELSDILAEYGRAPVRKYVYLDLGKTRRDANLMKMSLDVTEAEYRILLYLCNHTEKFETDKNILYHCFAESYRMVESNVRAHISSVNRKAKAICGRKLILRVREKGYILNKYM